MLIFRYFTREVLTTLMATLVVLLVIFVSNQFVHYLNDAAEGKITPQSVFELMTIQVPLFIGFLLPLSFYLGILLVVGRLCTDHELIALYSCGFSRAQLRRIVVVIALFVMGVSAWMMLWVEPKMEWQRARIISQAVSSSTLDKIQPGRFQLLGKNTGNTFYASDVNDNHTVMGNVVFAQSQKNTDLTQPVSWDIVSAQTANEIHLPENGQFLVFNKGYRYIGVPGQLDFRVVHFDRYDLRLSTNETDFSTRTETLPTMQLYAKRNQDPGNAAELHWRIGLPISALILALIALALSEVNPRSGKFARLFPAIVIYIVYSNLLIMGRAWIQKGVVSQAMGLWWVHGIFFVLALILLMATARR